MAYYSLQPVEVAKVDTKYRTIKTKIPVPESIKIFEQLENKLNIVAKENGEIILTVPFVTIDCSKF